MTITPVSHPTHAPTRKLLQPTPISEKKLVESRPSRLLSPEARLLIKLQIVGLLDDKGTLQAKFASPPALNQEQIERLSRLCQQQLCHGDMQVPHSSIEASHTHHLSLLNRLMLDPQESFLTGEAAAYVLGITDYFVAMVKTYLKDSPHPDDYCDEELKLLIARCEEQPVRIEFIDYIEQASLKTLEAIKRLYDKEIDSDFLQEIHIFNQSPSSRFLRVSYGQESFFVRNVGNVINPHSYTRDGFLIPVKFFLYCQSVQSFENPILYPSHVMQDFHQGVIDYSLKLMRLGQKQQSTWASTIYLQTLGYTVPNTFGFDLTKGLADDDLHQLKILQQETKSNAVALAFNAAQRNVEHSHEIFTKLCADFLPLHPVLVEIQELILANRLSIKTINAILAFTGWVQSCFRNTDWQKQIKLAIHWAKEEHAHVLLFNFEECQLQLPLQPYQALEQLITNTEDLREADQLLYLLLPKEINHLSASKEFIQLFNNPIYFEYFRSNSLKLLSFNDRILNQIGYWCILTNLALVGQLSGLELVFSKFFDLFPLDSKVIQKEFSLLATKLTPHAPFLGAEDANLCLYQFITHLFLQHHRHHALTLWHHHVEMHRISLAEQVSFLKKLFQTIASAKDFDEALFLFKPIFSKLEEDVLAGILKQIFQDIQESHQLESFILSTCSLFKYPLSSISSAFFTNLLEVAIQNELLSYTESALCAWAKGGLFSQKEWEHLCLALCQKLPNKAAFLSKRRLSSIRPFQAEKESASISEEELLKLPAAERILILQQAPPAIPLVKSKQMLTTDLLHLIAMADQDLLKILTTHSFNDDQCEKDKIIFSLLQLFNKVVPHEKEHLYFAFLLKIAKTSFLKEQAYSVTNQLLDRIHEHPSLFGQSEIALDLISYILETTLQVKTPQQSFIDKLIGLLEKTYRLDTQFQARLNHLITSYEQSLFSILIDHSFSKEAIRLLRLMDCYKAAKTEKSIGEDTLLLLLCKTIRLKEESLARMLLRCLPYLKNSCRLMTTHQTTFFKEWIAIFEEDEVMLNEILPHLNALFLNIENQKDLLASLIPAFQSKEKAFTCLLCLPAINRRLFFQYAHLHLFPHLTIHSTLSIIELHASEFRDSTLHPILEHWLNKAIEGKTPISTIIFLLKYTGYWHFTLLRELISKYPSEHEFLFITLQSLNAKGQFQLTNKRKKLANKNKKALFLELFKSFLKKHSSQALLNFLLQPNFDLFPSNERKNLINEFLAKVLEAISSSVDAMAHLQTLAHLAESESPLTEETTFRLFFALIKHDQLQLSAIRLALSLLNQPIADPSTYESILATIVKDHFDKINHESFLSLKTYAKIKNSHLANLLKDQWQPQLIRWHQKHYPHSQIPDEAGMINLALSSEDKMIIQLTYCLVTDRVVFDPSKLNVVFSIWQRAFLLARKIDSEAQWQEVLSNFCSFLMKMPNLDRGRLWPALEEAMETLLLTKDEQLLGTLIKQLFLTLILLESKNNKQESCYFQKYWKQLFAKTLEKSNIRFFQILANTLNAILKNNQVTIFDFWTDVFDLVIEKGPQESVEVLDCFFAFLRNTPKNGPSLADPITRDLFFLPLEGALSTIISLKDDSLYLQKEVELFEILKELEPKKNQGALQSYLQGYRILFISILLKTEAPSPRLLDSIVRSFQKIGILDPNLAPIFRTCIKNFIYSIISLGPTYARAFPTFFEAEKTWTNFFKQEKKDHTPFYDEYQRLSRIIHHLNCYEELSLSIKDLACLATRWKHAIRDIEKVMKNALCQDGSMSKGQEAFVESSYAGLQRVCTLLSRSAPLLSQSQDDLLSFFQFLFSHTVLASQEKKLSEIETVRIVSQFLYGLDLDEISSKKGLYHSLLHSFMKDLFFPILSILTTRLQAQAILDSEPVKANTANHSTLTLIAESGQSIKPLDKQLVRQEISFLLATFLERLYVIKRHSFFDKDFNFYIQITQQILPYLSYLFQTPQTNGDAILAELVFLFPIGYEKHKQDLVKAIVEITGGATAPGFLQYLNVETPEVEWGSDHLKMIEAIEAILNWKDELSENQPAASRVRFENRCYRAFNYFKQIVPQLMQDQELFLNTTNKFFKLLTSLINTQFITKEDQSISKKKSAHAEGLTKYIFSFHFINEFLTYLSESNLKIDPELYLMLFNDYILPIFEGAKKERGPILGRFLKSLVLLKEQGLFKDHFSQYIYIVKKTLPFVLVTLERLMQTKSYAPCRDYISPLITDFPKKFAEERQVIATCVIRQLQQFKLEKANHYADKIKLVLEKEKAK